MMALVLFVTLQVILQTDVLQDTSVPSISSLIKART